MERMHDDDDVDGDVDDLRYDVGSGVEIDQSIHHPVTCGDDNSHDKDIDHSRRTRDMAEGTEDRIE